MEGGDEIIRVRLRIKELEAALVKLVPGDPGRISLLEELIDVVAKDRVLLKAEMGA